MSLIKRFSTLVFFTMLLNACEKNHGVSIIDGWARANAPGQTSGAAYMTFLSAADTTFVRATSTIASSVEIHSMKMDNGVMKMRSLDELPIAAGKPEKLAPGGFHLMFFDLKQQLIAGEQIEVKLSFRDSAGKMTQQTVTLPVKEAN